MSGIRDLAWTLGMPLRLALIGLIRFYRATLGTMLGGQCRFYPSCSHYGEQAIREHGALRGSAMAAWRVMRCGPFTPGGVDHVPASRRSAGPAPGEELYDSVAHDPGGAASR
jgi:hypothetical protein